MVLTAMVMVCGCGGGEKSGEGGPSAKTPPGDVSRGAHLVIETGGRLPKASDFFKPWINGGLDVLGDVNGDGYADLIVGDADRPTSLAAFSGKDGHELWRVASKKGDNSYTLNDFAAINDQNGDAVREIFARNDWSHREAFILSGKDGAVVVRAETPRLELPLRVCDVDGDGADDLVFPRGSLMKVWALSVKDLSETLTDKPIKGTDGERPRRSWLLPEYPDLDGDGVDEYMLGAFDASGSEWVFLSGKDFSVVKRVQVAHEIASGSPKLICAGDLNGDSVADLVVTNSMGSEQDKNVSYLAAHSGADGAQLWQIAGNTLPGGPRRVAVDAATGQQRELSQDVRFGDIPAILTDLDGDGAREVACALPTTVEGKPVQAILVFSGASGGHLATLTLPKRQGRLEGDQMVLIERYTPDGKPALAVSGKVDAKRHMIAIFDLSKIGR